MNFQHLPVIDDPGSLLDLAFSQARKKVDVKDPRKRALKKALLVKKVLVNKLELIIKEFPDFDSLPDFYRLLSESQFDVERAKESLGRLQGVVSALSREEDSFRRIVLTSSSDAQVDKALKVFYARVDRLLRKVRSALDFLRVVREKLIDFPALKEGLFTVAITGFPNVGKSTLLSRLTRAKPKIANYAFTTKKLNVGYYDEGFFKIQVVDTPGTLNRFDRMNPVEQQAELCLKYVADLIVVVIDGSGSSYSLEVQDSLLSVNKARGKPLVVYLSKTDLMSSDSLNSLLEKYPGALFSVDDLKAFIKSEGQKAGLLL